MTYHTTKTGSIELLDSWGHGRAAKGDWGRRPATLIADDGDGHFDAWSYTGDRNDAATTIAGFFKTGQDARLAVLEGDTVYLLDRRQWNEGVEIVTETDEYGDPACWDYHPEAHPGGLLVV